ncbi:MAG: hypothetical protein GW760_02590 [Legionella sp.]|jgi:uncharacterized membrane protein|nr:hypothetical protein [Legionella sp.]
MLLRNYLNVYAWALMLAYLATIFAMNHHATGFAWQEAVFVLPIIFGMIFFSSRRVSNKLQSHEHDIFIISYSFVLAALVSIITQYDNSDIRGWWGIALYFYTFIGILFALYFAYFNQLKRGHQVYTHLFAVLILVVFALPNLWPRYITLKYLGRVEFYWFSLALIGLLHVAFFGLNKYYKKIF